MILIAPAGVLLPVCAQHDSTGRCWDVLIRCLKPAGPVKHSDSFDWEFFSVGRESRSSALDDPAGRTDKTGALVETHPSYCVGELSKPSVMSHLTVLEAAGAPPNTINLNLTLKWPLIRADLSSWVLLTQMHINLYSSASRGAFICNHLGKLPLLRTVIPLTRRLYHMQMHLFKMDIDWSLLRFRLFIKDNRLRDTERERMKGMPPPGSQRLQMSQI